LTHYFSVVNSDFRNRFRRQSLQCSWTSSRKVLELPADGRHTD